MSKPRSFNPDRIADLLPHDGLIMLSLCSAESALLGKALLASGDQLGAATFTGTMVPGYNRRPCLPGEASRFLTYFMTPELKAAGDRVTFLPLCYEDVLRELRRRRPAALVFMCSPPDADGRCSFGTQVDFHAALWRDIPVRIAHVNPLMPRTHGDPGIPVSEITAWCEAEEQLMEAPAEASDATARAIAAHIAPFVRDGATVQMGRGKIPGAVLATLTDRRNLRIHSGLIDDSLVDLAQAGALASGAAATVGVAIGTRRLYDAVSDPTFQFHPVTITHGIDALGALDGLVSINSAMEVDLFGQVHAELGPHGLMSGPGGASDFARGVRKASGLRIIALPADAGRGAISRIVGPGMGAGPVSLGRMDVDLIVTEHGVADLRSCSYHERAERLIAIAAPGHRSDLTDRWRDMARRL